MDLESILEEILLGRGQGNLNAYLKLKLKCSWRAEKCL